MLTLVSSIFNVLNRHFLDSTIAVIHQRRIEGFFIDIDLVRRYFQMTHILMTNSSPRFYRTFV